MHLIVTGGVAAEVVKGSPDNSSAYKIVDGRVEIVGKPDQSRYIRFDIMVFITVNRLLTDIYSGGKRLLRDMMFHSLLSQVSKHF